MLKETRGVLDEGTWQIVYSFFHPVHGGLGNVLFSGDIGSVTRAGITHGDKVYSGRPTSLIWETDEVFKEVDYWSAEIAVMSGMGISESLLVSVVDAKGSAIDAARLILLGSELTVSNGIAHYSLSEFQSNLGNTQVALVYPDGRQIPGALKLGAEKTFQRMS